MTDRKRIRIDTLKAVHEEFDATLCELIERTSTITALTGVALTIANRAFATPDPPGALRDFKRMLTNCYQAVAKSIEDGSWAPP